VNDSTSNEILLIKKFPDGITKSRSNKHQAEFWELITMLGFADLQRAKQLYET